MSAAAARAGLLGSVLIVLALVLAAPPAVQTQPASTDNCYICHMDAESPEAMKFQHDIHYQRGVGCSDCHGGDPTTDDQDEAMDKAKGFLGKIPKARIPEVCGKCHGAADHPLKEEFGLTNVVDSLFISAHGEAFRANSAIGPQCVSCHGVHDIARASDPRSSVHPSRVTRTCASCHSDASYMQKFNPGLPVDQYEKYLTSIHGKKNAQGDPKPATCVSCHSNHMVLKAKDPLSPVYPTRIPETCGKCHSDDKYMAHYKIPTDQLSGFKASVHGKALLEKSDLNAPACNSCHGNHGAIPPGAASVVAVCGNCHQMNEELYEMSAHREVFEEKKLPGCVACHGNHEILAATDELVSLEPPSPCAECHTLGGTDESAEVILHFRALLDSLQEGQIKAIERLDHAEQLGMDVADARYELKDANQALVMSRVAIHSFKIDELAEVARPGIAIITSAKGTADDAIKNYYFRRQGLAVSTLIVALLAITLYLKIRRIDKEAKRK